MTNPNDNYDDKNPPTEQIPVVEPEAETQQIFPPSSSENVSDPVTPDFPQRGQYYPRREYYPEDTQRDTSYMTQDQFSVHMLEDKLSLAQGQVSELKQEIDTVKEESAKKDSSFKIATVIATVLGFLAVVLLFWHPLGQPGNEAEIASKQTQIDQLTKDKESAEQESLEANNKAAGLEKDLAYEKKRADDAEAAVQGTKAELDKVTAERDKAVAEAEEAKSKSTTTTVTETVKPNSSKSTKGNSTQTGTSGTNSGIVDFLNSY